MTQPLVVVVVHQSADDVVGARVQLLQHVFRLARQIDDAGLVQHLVVVLFVKVRVPVGEALVLGHLLPAAALQATDVELHRVGQSPVDAGTCQIKGKLDDEANLKILN